MDPWLTSLYVNTEMTPLLVPFAREPATGALRTLGAQRLPLPEVTVPTANIAENFFHPSGRVLYVSLRGHNRISAFAVDASGNAS